MKLTTFFVALSALIHVALAQAVETVSATVNDLSDLKQVIAEANERPLDVLTLVYFKSSIALPEDESLPPIKARINFTSSQFYGVGGGPDRLFVVESTGIFGIRDSAFTDFTGGPYGPVLFENHGELVLRRVLFDSVLGFPVCGFGGICNVNSTSVIENAADAHLTLDGVKVIEENWSRPTFGGGNKFLNNEGVASLIRSQFSFDPQRQTAPLFNAGYIRIRNSSFMVHNPIDVATLPLLNAAESANANVVNSVFDGFTGDWCGFMTSTGHNTSTAHDCNWKASGDEMGVPTGLIYRPISSASEAHYFELKPTAASSIVDTADINWCPDGYTIYDGNGDGEATCDRGAIELKPTSLAEGGINGFYYNPDEDGHYVYVQQTDFTTLVMWNTFDADGNQAWIYGTGNLAAGRSLIAEAYINRTGGLTPDGLITDVEAEYWGELQVDMDSCAEGTVIYRSALPEFGSGEFPIERLAYVKQLGCVDR